MKWVWRGTRWLFVGVGIIVLTSFSIDATDTLRGSQSALSIFARNVEEGDCPSGMVKVDLATGALCVDVYENSVGSECPHISPGSELDTKANVDAPACQSVSLKEAVPWTYVSYHQAKSLCAKRGARLPSALEWYEAALGTPDGPLCNISGNLHTVASDQTCVSARGMYDMVGNVWEWVDGEVVDGQYANRAMPGEGYVTEVDASGVAVATAAQPSELYNNDYLWSSVSGTYGVMRGGFYGSKTDGGVFSVQAKVAHSFASGATGFRCVQDS